MIDQSQNNNPNLLIPQLEALLFVAPGPVSISQIAEVLGKKPGEVQKSLDKLQEEYRSGRGLRLKFFSGKVELTTNPEIAELIVTFLGLEATSRLSRAALETLSIIAYRQPITRPGIDSIRGVNSDGVLKSLLSKGLIAEIGRAETPGRPILYGVTSDFLQHFGLSSLDELPPYGEDEESNQNGNGREILKD